MPPEKVPINNYLLRSKKLLVYWSLIILTDHLIILNECQYKAFQISSHVSLFILFFLYLVELSNKTLCVSYSYFRSIIFSLFFRISVFHKQTKHASIFHVTSTSETDLFSLLSNDYGEHRKTSINKIKDVSNVLETRKFSFINKCLRVNTWFYSD